MSTKRNHKRKLSAILVLLGALGASLAFGEEDLRAQAQRDHNQEPLFLTATNGSTNFLAVVNTRTKQTSFVPTGGAGGVSGNAGGVAVDGKLAAVVNFGSTNVTIFVRRGGAMEPTQMIKTSSPPVSVAFGQNHLVALPARPGASSDAMPSKPVSITKRSTTTDKRPPELRSNMIFWQQCSRTADYLRRPQLGFEPEAA